MKRFVFYVKTTHRPTQQGENIIMKKLMIAALGLGLAIGSVSFAAPNKAQDSTTKKSKKKKTSTAPKM
jgi:hypothetical protein